MRIQIQRPLSLLAAVALNVTIAPAYLLAQQNGEAFPGAGEAEQKVVQHIKSIMQREKQDENEAKQLVEETMRRGKQKDYNLPNGRTEKGSPEHEWKQNNGNNPQSEQEYIDDSVRALDSTRFANEVYSCWHPDLLATGYWMEADRPPWATPLMAVDPALALACKFSCPRLPWALLGMDNGFEVIQYWWPEHEIYLNDYGINRLDPTQQSAKGAQYGRDQLISQEEQPEDRTLEETEQNYQGQFKEKEKARKNLKDPFRGQEWWFGVGIASMDFTDRYSSHVARTRVAYRTANARPRSWRGWLLNEIMIYDSFPPTTQEKDIINVWSESRLWNILTHVPQLSYQVGQRGQKAMEALFGPKEEFKEKAKENPPFWQSKGAPANRLARWQQEFQGLQSAFKIQPDNNPELREVVYRGGLELFPLVGEVPGSFTPLLSAGVVLARRSAYWSGTKDLLRNHTDGEKGRINEYTVDGRDKAKEVDRLQFIHPLIDKQKFSECFVTSVGAANSPNTTQKQWVKKNLPLFHVKLTKTKGQEGDLSFIYWNKRVACTCRYQGIPTGAWIMDRPADQFGPGRGSGDRPYGKIEDKLCTYNEHFAPSSFMNRDATPCYLPPAGPNNKNYEGLKDDV